VFYLCTRLKAFKKPLKQNPEKKQSHNREKNNSKCVEHAGEYETNSKKK